MPHLCCYAASSRTLAASLYQEAEDFGRRAAALGWDLVFGGANIGLMDAVARGFKSNGRRVFSVIPRLFDRQGLTYTAADDLLITEDLRERKRVMLDHAEAVVVLPGGPGTLDEFFETLTLRQLGFHSKPIILLNLGGHFDGTLAQIERIVEGGFANPRLKDMYMVAASVDEALGYLPPILD